MIAIPGVARAGTSPAPTAAPRPTEVAPAPRPLDLLVLGGTGFLGPHQIEYALARGHRVTMFNRGRSGAGMYGSHVEQLIGNRDARIDRGLAALAGERRWDVVIDNSGYVPRHVRDSGELLQRRVGRYLYVSTLSVYDAAAGAIIDEGSMLSPSPSPATEQVTWNTYGPLKAECDRTVREIYGARCTVIRPGFIVGPGDETDRFTYWVDRVSRGGDVLAPPDPGRALQWVDVRDLSPWIIDLAERDVGGVFNAAGPAERTTWAAALATLARLASSPVRFHWADPEVLRELGVDLPLVSLERAARYFRSDAAQTAGLRYRPLDDTARATLAWWQAQTAERRGKAEGWPTPEQERKALARLADS